MAHTLIKAEKLTATAATLVEQQLVVPTIFHKEGIEQFKGAKNDTVNIRVPGVLPWRTYGWRNDRTSPIVLDEYAERSVAVAFGGNIYSGVSVIDEQAFMDMDGYTDLVFPQTEAVGRGLEHLCINALSNQAYNVTLGGKVDADGAGTGTSIRSLTATLIRAREVMTRFNQPQAGRVLLVGTAWESALLSDDRLNLAQNVGDNIAEAAVTNATIGTRYGFRIVVAPDLPPTAAYALGNSAFVLATGAPLVPSSVPYGATHSTGRVGGVALRWMRDYDTLYQRDRSVVNTFAGVRSVDDPLVGINASDQAFVSTQNHFIRAIKLDLEATSDALPEAGSELATITGVSA